MVIWWFVVEMEMSSFWVKFKETNKNWTWFWLIIFKSKLNCCFNGNLQVSSTIFHKLHKVTVIRRLKLKWKFAYHLVNVILIELTGNGGRCTVVWTERWLPRFLQSLPRNGARVHFGHLPDRQSTEPAARLEHAGRWSRSAATWRHFDQVLPPLLEATGTAGNGLQHPVPHVRHHQSHASLSAPGSGRCMSR